MRNNSIKIIIISFLIFFGLIYPFLISLVERIDLEKSGGTLDQRYVHDSIIQTEEAIKYFLKGKNFYQENYFDTPLEKWNRGVIGPIQDQEISNPALYHYVYLPFYPLFSVPFYLLSEKLVHWYDQRIVHLIVFVFLIFFLVKLPKKTEEKLFLLSLFCLSPLFISFFIRGWNDIFVFFWIILTIYFLKKEKFIYSSLSFALACASKQSAWFFIPFYFAYLIFSQTSRTEKRYLMKIFFVFLITFSLIIIPFIIWDANNFIDDIYKGLSGDSLVSYPISGFGFSNLILDLGLIKSSQNYFPFWIFQLIFGLLTLRLLLKCQKKNNTLSQVMLNYGLFLFVIWFFSRYFHLSHLEYILMILTVAVFRIDKELEI